MLKPFAIALVGMLLLASCATPPSAEELANADYGSYPNDYKKIVKSYMQGILKDPGSAQYRLLKSPRQVWASYFGPVQYGYATCYAINAKNSFGGYTGEKTHYILIKNDVVIKHVYGKGGQYDIGESTARKGCSTF